VWVLLLNFITGSAFSKTVTLCGIIVWYLYGVGEILVLELYGDEIGYVDTTVLEDLARNLEREKS